MKTVIVQMLLVLLLCSAEFSYEDDRDQMALLEFKKAISQDPHQALMSWNSSSHFCTWEGVSCRLKNPSRVTSLDLSGRGLVGPIPPSVGNLTSLEYLFLNTNELTGEIPPSLGQLRHLRSLYLANNTLQGNIPSFANCSVLKILHLGDNQIVGHIPSQVNLPPSLSQLHLDDNNLTGTIPTSLSDIATLDTLILSYNYIHGTIPDEIGKFPILKFLYLGGNQLSGRLPPALLNLSSLLELGLAFNNFTGNLPSNLGSSLFNLQKFEMAANLFDGHIPYSLMNASSLYVVDLSDNYFSGVVPTSVGRLKDLFLLNLQSNQFESHGKKDLEFMHSLGNCSELQILALYGNNLQGQIQYSLGNLSVQLQQLYLGSNKLSGGFPSGIRNLPNLISLSLENNHFTGAVPEWVGTLANLQGLYVDHNKFTGFIPSSLSNLSQLVDLLFSTNQFQGHIPADLGKLQVLHQLNFSDNNLHGTIPKEIFNIPTIAFCSLSSNNLDGALPTEIGNAKQLQYLQLSSNKLSGHIPNTLSNCESMEEVKLDQNFLDGSIPPSLGNMTSMTVLNLSYNNLSGSIPKSLGSLQNLEQLDLSFNHLVGEVPEQGVFKNATAIWIKGNQGLCGGALEQYLPRCPMTSTSSTKYMPSHLVKVLIPVVSILSVAMIIFAFLFWRKRQNVGLMLLPSFGRRFPKVSYKDLAMATKGFSASNLIGTGRYGTVYMGNLLHDDEYVVAVKVLRLNIAGAERSFVAECDALRVVRHRNLVPILTACSSIDSSGNDFKALVYKFMPQGDLHQLLHSAHNDGNSSRLKYLSLAQRLNIVVDVSDAMVYLHHDYHEGSIVHCDLKPSNILLDDDMIAHVGDFGLARLQIHPISSSYGDSTSSSSVAIHGTVGYIAPECGGGGQVSTAADVYSFGVVLLEIFIRRRPTDDMFRDGLSIAKFAEINLPDKMLQIVDPQLLQELDLREEALIAEDNGVHCLVSVLDVGLCCTKSSPSERVSMQEVSARLHGIRDGYLRGQEEN